MTCARRMGGTVVLLAAVLAAACTGGQSSEPTTSTPTDLAPAQADKVRAYLDGLAASGRLSGAVSVSADGRTFAAAYGTADPATMAPNTLDTRFRIGSVSKQLTAAAVLLLQERHQLLVTDPLCVHLPDCPPAWTSITLEQLLTHQSGIPDHTSELALPWPLPESSEWYVDQLRDRPLHFSPGSRLSYSSANYLLLALVVERVSGAPFADFLAAEVLGPLQMANTGTDTTQIRPGHATGAYADGTVPPAFPMSLLLGAGDLYSTVGDLQRWDDALDRGTLLPEAVVRTMLDVHAKCPGPSETGWTCPSSSTLGTGYGWFVAQSPVGLVDEHAGHIDGFAAINAIYPEHRLHVVVLTNNGATDVDAASAEVARLATQ
ncbi:MAG: serine hydrolase domain-containing protein [Dermatophilaceae bacterium]